ncbi:hypothetical protein SELMODRAFT_232898 [Selaginella moellendorffii]|uniref:ARM repeat N-terminal plant domain-containing protein n=1 Tax=Selaginella moellendorffii TaxID=88036 RepID=D8S142_SELML|nr:uncharacterized protein LOC9638626 [Selaginella moellendorffii]EFJ21776.1 hypothetical protein SELMODRAFT_232898 [Selaginella moellendorffii]|eukprot:XP_002977167.1 uncharacterized protein LOC9638626 [Selaginella moellendorffii]
MDACKECPYPGCLFCLMKENVAPSKRRSSIAQLFKQLPERDEPGQVMAISGLWNAALLRPTDGEFIELGIFECMAALIFKGIRDRKWLASDQNIFIPYYAAHIIGSYTMIVEEFAIRAVQAKVIPALLELLKGKLTWVEQRVALRALGHLATYESTFSYILDCREILDVAMKLAADALDIVYTQFYRFVDRRLEYHQDLLTRGLGGVEMESRKAEEWASQLQCWSLQLINCFAFREEYLAVVCGNKEFLCKLLGMWGGLVNESSPAGIGLLRSICRESSGRVAVADCPGVVNGLCNVARSSDDWQYMAVDCLVWLVQDVASRHKVLDQAACALVDLTELSTMSGDQKKLGDLIATTLLRNPAEQSQALETRLALNEVAAAQQRMKLERDEDKDDLRIRKAAAMLLRLEGNARFASGDIHGAACKYTEALELCPLKAKKQRASIYSNRAQCHLLSQNNQAAISDSTRALCLQKTHRDSLWRRAQAYEMEGLPKESLLDGIMYMIECSQKKNRKSNVPDYIEALIKKQMRATWLFKEASQKWGAIEYRYRNWNDNQSSSHDESEWETASDDS